MIDPLGNTTSQTLDPLGRLATVTDAGGDTTTFSYDARGRLVTIMDAVGAVETRSYSPEDIRVSTLDPLGRLTSLQSDSTVIDYGFDALDRLVSGTGLSRGYDAAGRLVESNGITVGRDAAGRIASVTLAPGKTLLYLANRTLTPLIPNELDPISMDILGDFENSGHTILGAPTVVPPRVGDRPGLLDISGGRTPCSWA